MRLACALAGCLAIAACRRIDPGRLDDAPLAPQQLTFDRDVYPILAAKCGSSECHGEAGTFSRTPTRFVAAEPSAGWFTAINFYALVGPFTFGQAPILRRVGAGDHQSVTYSDHERAAITAWLDEEVVQRTFVSVEEIPALSAAVDEELARYRGCMTATDFDDANMASWATVQSQDTQYCSNCHANGAGGFIATGNVTAFYEALRARQDLFLQYITVDGGAGVANVNYESFYRIGSGADPHREHPRFDGFSNPGMQALMLFDMKTRERMSTGCEPDPFPRKRSERDAPR